MTAPNRFEPIVDKDGKPTRRLAEFLESLDGGDTTTVTQIVTEQTVSGTETAESTAESLTFSYNGDGTVASITGATTNIVFTYSSGLVSTIYDQTYLKTFSYNGSNQLTNITVT